MLIRKYRYITFLSFLLVLQFCSCRTNYGIQSEKTERGSLSVDSIVVPKPDSLSVEIIKPYRTQLKLVMDEVLAYSEKAMMKQQPEGLLNNFLTDLMLKKSSDHYKAFDTAKIDMVLFNNGGIRSSIPKGAITLENVYQLMPFENMVTVVLITGSNTKKMFDYIAQKNGMPISGAKLGINKDKPVDILINGQPLDTNRNYRVATSDYLADGGDNMIFLMNPISKTSLNIKLRDMIIEYLKEETAKGKTINASLDKRIYYAK